MHCRRSSPLPADDGVEGGGEDPAPESGVTKIYVDASAGGSMASEEPARVYLRWTARRRELQRRRCREVHGVGHRVQARRHLHERGGDARPGKGRGPSSCRRSTRSPAPMRRASRRRSSGTGDREPQKDAAGFVLTTFSDWYDYIQETHIPTPFPDRTLVMKSADGNSTRSPSRLARGRTTARPPAAPPASTSFGKQKRGRMESARSLRRPPRRKERERGLRRPAHGSGGIPASFDYATAPR